MAFGLHTFSEKVTSFSSNLTGLTRLRYVNNFFLHKDRAVFQFEHSIDDFFLLLFKYSKISFFSTPSPLKSPFLKLENRSFCSFHTPTTIYCLRTSDHSFRQVTNLSKKEKFSVFYFLLKISETICF